MTSAATHGGAVSETAATSDLDALGTGNESARKQALLDVERPETSFDILGMRSGPDPRTASPLLFVAVLVCCVSHFMYGFSLCFTSPAQSSMEGKPKVRYVSGQVVEVFPPSDLAVFLPAQFTFYAALFTMGALAGAFMGSAMSNRYGRKRTLELSACPHVVSWLATAWFADPVLLTMARMLTGFAVGIGAAVMPCYISEVSTISVRGPLGAVSQLYLTCGLFATNLLGSYATVVKVEEHTFCDWRRLALLGMMFAAVLFFMAFMPESPKWLAQQGHVQAAKLALRRLRVGDTTAEEIELEAAVGLRTPRPGDGGGSSRTVALSYSLSDCRVSLIIAMAMLFFLQFSGITAVMMFTTDICAKAGMTNAELCTVSVMVARIVFGGASCAVVETMGRRRLLQSSSFVMGVCHVALSYYYSLMGGAWEAPPWVALAALSLYVTAFASGMGPVPWIIVGEIFPVEVAGVASAMATSVGWVSSFVVCVGFRHLQATVGIGGAFLFFSMPCFACTLFVTALLPETKGKSIEEVLQALNSGCLHVLVGRRRFEDATAPKSLYA